MIVVREKDFNFFTDLKVYKNIRDSSIFLKPRSIDDFNLIDPVIINIENNSLCVNGIKKIFPHYNRIKLFKLYKIDIWAISFFERCKKNSKLTFYVYYNIIDVFNREKSLNIIS